MDVVVVEETVVVVEIVVSKEVVVAKAALIVSGKVEVETSVGEVISTLAEDSFISSVVPTETCSLIFSVHLQIIFDIKTNQTSFAL